MLTEPELDRAVLAAALEREYGLAASAVRFIPAGETAWCYQVTDERDGRWFLKLGQPGAIEPARAEFALRLADVLAGLGLPVPRPQPTQAGELWCWLDGLRVAVFEFIDGEPLGDHDLQVPGVARQAARLVAAVHAATPALVWPHRASLLGMQDRVQTLEEAVRSQPRERVLCHGDLIGDNLLGDRAGRLWAVDWDAAALAPRERDLALFAGQGFGRFLDGYEHDAGAHGLDPDLVAFFLLRRNLDDLVDWLGAILANDRPDAQRRAHLDGVGRCLSRWAALEARIGHTRRVLARRHGHRQRP